MEERRTAPWESIVADWREADPASPGPLTAAGRAGQPAARPEAPAASVPVAIEAQGHAARDEPDVRDLPEPRTDRSELWADRSGRSPISHGLPGRLGAAGAVAVAAVAVVVAVVLAAPLKRTLTSGNEASAAPSEGRPVTIGWVGDMTLGSVYGQPADQARGMFEAVRSRLRRPELMIGNLEGTLGNGGASKCGPGTSGAASQCFAFQAPAANATALHDAGFDLLNVANNHADDFGAIGQQQTTQALVAHHLRWTGKPGQITILRRNDTTVAAVGFAAYRWAADLRDLTAARALVARAAQRADLVVVLMHAGSEGVAAAHTPVGTEYGYGADRGDTRRFAHTAIDAGADLVLGSGPHVVRGMETYHGRLIAYSLGNFAGEHNFGMGGALSQSGLLTVTLSPTGHTLGGRWTPIILAGPGHPQPDPIGASTATVRALSQQDFASPAPLAPDGRIAPLR